MTIQNLINRSQQTTHYTVTPNEIINNESLSSTARAILIYLVSKPPHWRFNVNDVKRNMGIGTNKVYRCMSELISAGYAYYKRTQAKVYWYIFDTPQTIKLDDPHVDSHCVTFKRVENGDVLESNQILENIKNHNSELLHITESITPVVVSEEEKHGYPEQISPLDLPAVKSILAKVDEPKIKQEILFALTYALTHGQVKSTPAYLCQLVKAVKNGTFTPIKPKIQNKPIKLWSEQKLKPQPKVDNDCFFAELTKRFGDKANRVLPEEYRPGVRIPA